MGDAVAERAETLEDAVLEHALGERRLQRNDRSPGRCIGFAPNLYIARIGPNGAIVVSGVN